MHGFSKEEIVGRREPVAASFNYDTPVCMSRHVEPCVCHTSIAACLTLHAWQLACFNGFRSGMGRACMVLVSLAARSLYMQLSSASPLFIGFVQ